MQRTILCLVVVLTLAQFAAAQEAADPWAPLNLQPVPFDGGTLMLEPALADKREAIIARIEDMMQKVAEARAAREAAAADAPKIVAAIHRITGLAVDHAKSEEIFTTFARDAALVPAPPDQFRVYAVRSDTLKASLRSGTQLPEFTYDAQSDVASYRLNQTARRGGSIVLHSIPIILSPDGVNHLQPIAESLSKIPSLEMAVHEVAELAVFRRLGEMKGAHFRWLSDGLANVITEQVLREVYDEDKAQGLRKLLDPAPYADLKDQVNLRYWLSSDFDPAAALPAEQRLTHARYAYSYALMRRLVADKGPERIDAILSKAAEHPRCTPVHLTEAIAAVTGADVGRELDAFQTFGTTAEGIAYYEHQLLSAREKGGDEAALSVIVRLLELSSTDNYRPPLYRMIAVHLRRLGNAAAGADLLRKQVHTAGNHIAPEAQHLMKLLLVEYATESRDMSLAFKPAEAESWGLIVLELAQNYRRTDRVAYAAYLVDDLLTRCADYLSEQVRSEAQKLAGP